MDIQKTLNEVGDYFKQKVIDGEYKFISCAEHTASIEIDNYPLYLWISGDVKTNFEFYWYTLENSEMFNHFKFANQKDRAEAYSRIKPMITAYKSDILIKEKQAELKKLTNDVEKLKNK